MRAAAALVTALALVAGLTPAASANRHLSPAEVESRTAGIARQLRCPVCQQLSVEDSPSEVSRSFRRRIRELVVAGRSEEEIKAFFVARYGDWILLSPPRRGMGVVVWVAPVLVLLAGLTLVAVAVRRWSLRSRRLAAAAQERPEALARARARLDALEREPGAS